MPTSGQSEAGSAPSPDEEVLALRLRVAELERQLAGTMTHLATRTALLDSMDRSRVWRGVERVARIRRVLGPDGAVAAGYDGSGALGVRVPLAGLLGSIEGGPGAPWTDEIDVAGVALGGLAVDPPTVLAFPVRGLRTACVRAFAALRPGSWPHNRGGVRFRIRLVDTAGHTLAETVRDVDPGARRADRRWVPLTLSLPPVDAEGELTITTELPPDGAPDFSWAVLGDPVLLVAPNGESVAPLLDGGVAFRTGRARLRRRLARRGPITEDTAAPLISILLPVHNPEPELLQQTVGSVFAQSSGHWELSVVDDGSTRPGVAAILDGAARDARVTLQRHDRAKGISAATNAALARARGAFVATLDHDDLLAPEGIAAVGARLAVDPDIDVLYTDNDKVAAGVRFSPSLKPGWSPDLLRACMYTLHFSVFRRTLVQEIGGWRSDFDGAQDHDLMLRASERTDRIDHLPQTLYSWRAHAGSAALGALAKPEAYDRGREAVQEHLRRAGVEASAEALPIAGRFRVAYAARGERVAVVLPLRARLGEDPRLADHLGAVAAALDADRAHPVGLVVVATERTADAATAIDDRATHVSIGGGTWGSLARAGIAATNAEVLVLLEELSAPLTPDWLEELTGPLRDRGVCASSPLVIDHDDRVVHAGVALLHGLPLPVHPGANIAGEDLPPELTMVTNRSAAAGVVALTRSALDRGGGPDERRDHLALATLTAGLTREGARVVCSPHAPWRLLGPPRPNDLEELRAFAIEHARCKDRFYSPRLWEDNAAHIVPRALQQTGLLSDARVL